MNCCFNCYWSNVFCNDDCLFLSIEYEQSKQSMLRGQWKSTLSLGPTNARRRVYSNIFDWFADTACVCHSHFYATFVFSTLCGFVFVCIFIRTSVYASQRLCKRVHSTAHFVLPVSFSLMTLYYVIFVYHNPRIILGMILNLLHYLYRTDFYTFFTLAFNITLQRCILFCVFLYAKETVFTVQKRVFSILKSKIQLHISLRWKQSKIKKWFSTCRHLIVRTINHFNYIHRLQQVQAIKKL